MLRKLKKGTITITWEQIGGVTSVNVNDGKLPETVKRMIAQHYIDELGVGIRISLT